MLSKAKLEVALVLNAAFILQDCLEAALFAELQDRGVQVRRHLPAGQKSRVVSRLSCHWDRPCSARRQPATNIVVIRNDTKCNTVSSKCAHKPTVRAVCRSVHSLLFPGPPQKLHCAFCPTCHAIFCQTAMTSRKQLCRIAICNCLSA